MRIGRLLVVALFALGLVGGLSACSPPRYDTAVDVYVDGDRIVLGADYTFSHGPAGRNFQVATTTDGVSTVESLGQPDSVHPDGPQRVSCLADRPAHCFRAVDGRLAVEETTDGVTWQPVWEVPESRRAYLARQYQALGSMSANLSTVAVAALDGPSGIVVAVANGRDGFALRDGAGHWRRIGIPPSRPASLTSSGGFVFYEYGTAALLTAAVALLGVAAAQRGWRRRLAWGVLLLAPVVGWGLFMMILEGEVWLLHQFASLMVLVPITGGALAAGVVVTIRRRTRWRSGIGLLAVPVCAGLGMAAAFFGWSAGTPDSYRVALLIALTVFVVAAVAVVPFGRRLAGAPPPAEPEAATPEPQLAGLPS